MQRSPYRNVAHPTDLISSVESQLQSISRRHSLYQCETNAYKLAKYLENNNEQYEILRLSYQKAYSGIIVSLMYTKDWSKPYIVAYNGYHYGVLYKGNVYCNVHPYGLPQGKWEQDFYAEGGEKVVESVSLNSLIRFLQ